MVEFQVCFIICRFDLSRSRKYFLDFSSLELHHLSYTWVNKRSPHPPRSPKYTPFPCSPPENYSKWVFLTFLQGPRVFFIHHSRVDNLLTFHLNFLEKKLDTDREKALYHFGICLCQFVRVSQFFDKPTMTQRSLWSIQRLIDFLRFSFSPRATSRICSNGSRICRGLMIKWTTGDISDGALDILGSF